VTALIAEIEANLRHAEAITRGLSERQFTWRPEPGRWSIGDCLGHLNTVDGMDVAPLRSAVATGVRGSGPFTYGALSCKFVASMEPPVKRKMRAPKAYEPPPPASLEKTLGEYRRIVTEIRALAEAAEGLHLAKVKTSMPALPAFLRPFIKMPLGARLELIAAHDRRHLWQAEQIRNDPAFPR
jgi:hypothetical protein